MTLIKLIMLIASICIVNARTIIDDPGHSTFGYSTTSPPFDLNQGEVVMKEAVLYLTPSQIKAFEASQGQITHPDLKNQFTEEEIQNVEAEIKRQLEKQNIYAFNQNSNEKPILYPNQPPPVVEEPISESPVEYVQQYEQKWKPVPNQPEDQKYFIPQKDDYQKHKVAESYSYVKFFTDHNVHETPKLQLFHPIPHEEKVDPELSKFLEVQGDPVHHKEYKLVPYEYKALEVPRYEDVKEITKLTALLEKFNKEQNVEQQKHDFFEPAKEQNEKLEQYHKDLSELKYTPKFEEHKNTAEAQKFLINIEKENALARAEAILKAPPAPVRKEVIVKRRPILYHGKDRPHLTHRHHPDLKKRFL